MRAGATIGPYRLVREIGRGGMGAVYLGEHTLIGRSAAIKILLPELSAQPESVDRFFNEARAMHVISDPGIVGVYDFGFTAEPAQGGVAYIVMELLEGEQLSKRLRRLGKLAPGDALWIARQVAGSLAVVHGAGVVHRDLKPENLYLVPDATLPGGERPKILDFGIAKLTSELPGQVKTQIRTHTGAVLGTPVYMSPEQCNDTSTIDHRSDIYALGCVLFHLLTGRPPFDHDGVGALISAHVRDTAPLPSALVPLPPGLDELVMRCLAKAPRDRFATMYELQQACDGVLAHIATARPETWSQPVTVAPTVEQPSTRRRRLVWWIAASALAGGIGSGAAVVMSNASARPEASAALPLPAAAPEASAPGPARASAPKPAAVAVVPAPVAVPAVAPPAAPTAAATSAKLAPAKSAAPHPRPSPSPSPPSPSKDDVYDDRN